MMLCCFNSLLNQKSQFAEYSTESGILFSYWSNQTLQVEPVNQEHRHIQFHGHLHCQSWQLYCSEPKLTPTVHHRACKLDQWYCIFLFLLSLHTHSWKLLGTARQANLICKNNFSIKQAQSVPLPPPPKKKKKVNTKLCNILSKLEICWEKHLLPSIYYRQMYSQFQYL